MSTWQSIGIICGSFAAVGASIDRMILRKHKIALHEKLIRWWDVLDETRIPDLARLMASNTLSLLARIFITRRLGWRTLLSCIVISFVVTSLGDCLGNWYGGNFADFLEYTPVPLPIFTVYIGNFLFDLLTIVVTVKMLAYIIKAKSLILQTTLIAADVTVAAFLAILCLASLLFAMDFAMEYELPGSGFAKIHRIGIVREAIDEMYHNPAVKEYDDFYKQVSLIYSDPNYFENVTIERVNPFAYGIYVNDSIEMAVSLLVTGEYWQRQEERWTFTNGDKVFVFEGRQKGSIGFNMLFMSWTTLIPTALYCLVLLLLIMGKAVLSVCRIVAKLLFERITDDDPRRNPKDFMPFTMLGLLFAGLAVCVTVVVQLLKIVW